MSLDQPVNSQQLPLVLRAVRDGNRVLTPDALTFLGELQRRFGMKLHALMVARQRRQEKIDAGQMPTYLPETRDIREGIWEAAPVPEVLRDRRVEIAGPVERRAMIDALNSGARVFMADFEDATAPSFRNIIAGHLNVIDYRDGALEHDDIPGGRSCRVGAAPAVLMLRPRGLHMSEVNVLIGGQPISAALFDFGLSLFHCGRAFAAVGRGPFYYLPKLESHREAAFWNEVFCFAQDRLGLARGTIRATVLIETLTAAFEMDEIVWEMRDHIAGLKCGRRDYIFSYIKTLRQHSQFVLPDSARLAADEAFLATYAARLVEVCHRRGIHAIGAMAAAIPDREDEAATAAIRADALRELQLGHDGTWVAHPALVPVVMQVFDSGMPGPNQIRLQRQTYRIEPEKLLHPHRGQASEAGLRANVAIAIEYLANWLQGQGAVPVGDMVAHISSAEIARAQIWQWIRHGVDMRLPDGSSRRMDGPWLGELVQAEISAILDRLGPAGFHRGHYASAARILIDAATGDVLPDFLTTAACEVLNALD